MRHFSNVVLDGLHRAVVLNNDDEFGRERLFVRVLDVHDIKDLGTIKQKNDYGVWIEHCAPSSSVSGDIPEVGEEVWMLFLGDIESFNPTQGVWLGVVRKNNFKRK